MCRAAVNTIRNVITPEQHLNRILAETGRLANEVIPIAGARGRCLAEPVTAAVAVPPWTNSAMDGYAVRVDDISGATADRPVALEVVADVPAGSGEDPTIGPGQAARIMTGAPLPTSADTVVPQELTDGGLDLVQVFEGLTRGRHVREAGEDRESGSTVTDAGRELTPEMIASIASVGVPQVTVSRRPRVVVISTGDELVPAGQQLSRGQIPETNGLLISFLANDAGAETVVAHASDKPGDLEDVIDRHRGFADALVITGGVSVGAFDPVKALFGHDDRVGFDRVAIQPGKPQAFGRLERHGPLVFGLPGNPVSAWTSFQVFVRPALRKLQGYRSLTPRPVPSLAGEGWRTPRGRKQVIPVRITDGEARRAFPAAEGGSGSHLIASLAAADGYALVEAEVNAVSAGDRLQTVRLRDPEQFDHEKRSGRP